MLEFTIKVNNNLREQIFKALQTIIKQQAKPVEPDCVSLVRGREKKNISPRNEPISIELERLNQ